MLSVCFSIKVIMQCLAMPLTVYESKREHCQIEMVEDSKNISTWQYKLHCTCDSNTYELVHIMGEIQLCMSIYSGEEHRETEE